MFGGALHDGGTECWKFIVSYFSKSELILNFRIKSIRIKFQAIKSILTDYQQIVDTIHGFSIIVRSMKL